MIVQGAARGFRLGSQVPQCLVLDGVNEYAYTNDAANELSFERTGAFTLSHFLRPASLQSKLTINKCTPSGLGYVFSLQSSGALYFRIGNNFTDLLEVFSVTGAYAANTWQHIAVTYDGSSDATGVKFYVNGVLKSNASSTNTIGSTTVTSGENLVIGSASISSPGFYYSGRIADVAVHSRALTAAELLSHSAQPFPDLRGVTTTSANLVAYWRPEATDTHTSIQDLTANNNDLVGVNLEAGDIIAA